MDLFSEEFNLRRRHMREADDMDPMSSVANIADAMLVFACGLLISIVLAWNLDISDVTQVEIDQSQQIQDLQNVQDFMESEGSGYTERGTVYQDPNTGQLYLLENKENQGASGS